jgi:hypothetical protein
LGDLGRSRVEFQNAKIQALAAENKPLGSAPGCLSMRNPFETSTQCDLGIFHAIPNFAPIKRRE